MPKLRKGAKVALVAPASAVPENRLQDTVQAVRQMGLEPVVYTSCKSRHGNLAGQDRLRADDLLAAFADPEIKGVLCARGGYGCHRLLPLLDIPMMAASDKWFGGYSDITALHIALNQSGLPTYHCPMPSTEWRDEKIDLFTKKSLLAALFGHMEALENPAAQPLQTLGKGSAEGVLCGGNLSLVVDSLGTPWELDTRGKLLFLEDIGEKPYRIDGMLTQLRNAGKLADCAGILLGAWTDCTAPKPEESLPLETIFDELLPKDKPVLAGVACGHTLPTLTLPLGALVRMDTAKQSITVLEER